MARNYEQYTSRGATVAGIVVDSPEANAAMVEKIHLPFPILSDPDGSGAIEPLDVMDGNGPGARPAIIALSPDGREVFRYVGEDYLDRPDDDVLLNELDALQLNPVETPAETLPHLEPNPGRRAVGLKGLEAYMRGVRYASVALSGRMRDDADRRETDRTVLMAEAYIKAIAATLRME